MSETEIESRIVNIEARLQALEASITALNESIDRTRIQLMSAVDRTIGDSRTFNRPRRPEDGSQLPVTPEGFPYLGRNLKLVFADTSGTAIFLSAGWWQPEEWGVWGRGHRHVLRFAVDGSYHGGFLDGRLEFRYMPVEGMNWPTVVISANGYHLGSFVGRKAPWFVTFRLPPSCIGDGNVLLALDYDSSVLAGAVNGTDDGRRVGLGLVSLELL